MATEPESTLDRLAVLLMYVANATDGQLGERHRKALAGIIASADQAAEGSRLLRDLQGNPREDTALLLARWLTAAAEADPESATALAQWRHRLRAVEELADQTARRKAASSGAQPREMTAAGRIAPRSAAARWAAAITIAVVVFALTTWLTGAIILPLFLKDAGYRSVVATSLGLAVVSMIAAWSPTFADLREPPRGEAANTPRGGAEPSEPTPAAFAPVPAGTGPVTQVSGSGWSRQLVVSGDQSTVTVGGPTWMFVAVAGLAIVMAAVFSVTDLIVHTDHGSANQPGTGAAATTSPAASIETLVLGNTTGEDFYWPGSEPALNTSLEKGTTLAQAPGIQRIYAQSSVRVSIQTASTEQILISGFRVVNVQHSSPPKAGIVVHLPCDGCGGEQPARKFTVDLDAPAPQIGAGSSASSGDYYFVSATSSEEFLITFVDHTACTFDFEIDWVAAGKQHSTIVDNGGQPFRVLGDATLPRFEVDGTGGATFLVPQAPGA